MSDGHEPLRSLAGPYQVAASLPDFPAVSNGVTIRTVTEDDAVRIVQSYIEGLFPKVCSRCERRFSSLREHLELATHLGSPNFYEAAGGEPNGNPLGPIAHATCVCGNTLTIGSEGIPKTQLVELITWAKADAHRRSTGMTELLRQLRDRIDQQVLSADEDGIPDDRD